MSKKVFVQGAIPAEKIRDSIASHAHKTEIGAHAIFLGQVRADEINGKTVQGIEYSAYEEMADSVFHQIREQAFKLFDITCLHIYHSIGYVKAGEISFFVFVSSAHRKVAFEACEWIVEKVKKEVPIYGKEIINENDYFWKENK